MAQIVATLSQWHATTILVGVDWMIFRELEEVIVQSAMVKKYTSLEALANSKFLYSLKPIGVIK